MDQLYWGWFEVLSDKSEEEMDMEAEMVYADILRTLQSSILNTNVSLTTESRKLSSSFMAFSQ